MINQEGSMTKRALVIITLLVCFAGEYLTAAGTARTSQESRSVRVFTYM
jgi:hypothetical protein